MYNIHNKSTSRYHFDSCFRCHRCRRFVCNFNWRLFGWGACKTKANKKTAATQLSATKWTYIYVHFFTWHSFFLLLYDVDHNVIFCDVAATVAPIIAVGCVMTFLSTQWTRKFVFDYCLSLVMKSNIPASFGLSLTFTPFFPFAPFFSFAPVFLFAPSIPDYLFFLDRISHSK